MPLNTYRPLNQITGFDFNSLYAQTMRMNSCNNGIYQSESSILTNFLQEFPKQQLLYKIDRPKVFRYKNHNYLLYLMINFTFISNISKTI